MGTMWRNKRRGKGEKWWKAQGRRNWGRVSEREWRNLGKEEKNGGKENERKIQGRRRKIGMGRGRSKE